MSGTLSSFNTALSALRYNQTALDVASGNIANASNPAYNRRQVVAQPTGAPLGPAIWSRWTGAGDGVQAGGVDRMVDVTLDGRVRTEHASSEALSTRSASLSTLETALGEPGDNGVSAALDDFSAGWHAVANAPGDSAVRSALLGKAQTLVTAINNQATAVGNEWDNQHDQATALVDQVNQTATQLAAVNKDLKTAHQTGTDANTLLDQRDQLTRKLAELTGASVSLGEDTTATVTLPGSDGSSTVTLVAGDKAGTVSLQGATTLGGAQAAANTNPPTAGVTLQVDGSPAAAVSVGTGQLGGSLSLMNHDLPGYLSNLDGFVGQFADGVNTLQSQGADLSPQTADPRVANGQPFFTGTTAATLSVAITDPSKIAAADPTKGQLDGSNAATISDKILGVDTYRSLVTSFGVQVASANAQSATQDTLTAQVDSSKQSLSGVNIDEEMVNLLTAQRGYEGASKVLTTLDSMLDTLINRTGVTA